MVITDVLIIEDDEQLCRDYEALLSTYEGMQYVGHTGNAETAKVMITACQPDALILDLELHQGSGSGFDILSYLRTSPPTKMPYILVTTNNTSYTTHDLVRSLGGDFIISKRQLDFSARTPLDFLFIIAPSLGHVVQKSITSTPQQKNTNASTAAWLMKRTMQELDQVGISQKSVGYQYLVDAILFQLTQSSCNRGIVTQVAEKHKKSDAGVKMAMQNAINRAWRTGNTDDLLSHYTAKISSEKGNPTIVEFVCYYANMIRIDCNLKPPELK